MTYYVRCMDPSTQLMVFGAEAWALLIPRLETEGSEEVDLEFINHLGKFSYQLDAGDKRRLQLVASAAKTAQKVEEKKAWSKLIKIIIFVQPMGPLNQSSTITFSIKV